MSNVRYVGMDVHKVITVIVVLNALGHMESHSKVKTKAENICDFFRRRRAKRRSASSHVGSGHLKARPVIVRQPKE